MAKGKAQIVGWKYSLGMHMILCHGPVDEVQAISFGEREAWSGSLTGSGRITVNAPNLFGGDQREGGVFGAIDICMGEDTQLQNDYLVSKLGARVPAYRGVVGAVFRKFNIGSNNPYVKPLAIRIKRIVSGWSIGAPWYPEKVNISGAMNPAHMVYECITNTEWGMGYPTSTIDDAQFRQAADALYSESFGLCLLWLQQRKIEEFVGDILDHIGGILRVDPITGLFQLPLIRDNYIPSSLPSFNESNIIELKNFQRPTWGETTNEIVVKYTNMLQGTPKIISVQDLANIAIQGNVVSASREYPGIVSDDIAAKVAMRDLRANSTPLAKFTMTVNRTAVQFSTGDVVKVSWAAYGIVDMPVRILKVSQGTLVSGKITMDVAEDIFGMPSTSYVAPQGVEWVSPETPPVPVINHEAYEVPYYELATGLTAADFAQLDETSAFFAVIAESPSPAMFSFNVAPQDGSTYTADSGQEFCPYAQLNDPLVLEVQSTILVQNAVDLDLVEVGSYAYIDQEVVEVVSINPTLNQLVVNRAVLDTVPATHNAGAKIYFAEDYQAAVTTEYVINQTVPYKLLTVSALGSLGVNSAPTHSKFMTGRFIRPYPPANVMLNGERYPVQVDEILTLTWAHRDRTLQTAGYVSQIQGNIGPESGTTYNVRYYRQSSGALLQSVTGISGTSHVASLPTGTYVVRVELECVRDGWISMQKHSILTIFNKPTAERITEASDVRVDETGNLIRAIE